MGPLLFILYTSDFFYILENKPIGCADDSTLMAGEPSPGVRITVAESLIRDLRRVNEWCDICGMKLNANNTKTMIVFRSRTDQRSVSLLCTLYKFRCTLMHYLYGGLPVPDVPELVTCVALVAHQYNNSPPRCRTCSTASPLFLSQCPCGTIFLTL